MFVIGLEFNLPKLMGMKRLVFGLGMGQVLFTIVGALAGHAFMGVLAQALGWSWDLSWQGAVALGAAMAMSSTAIVARLMAERLELESEHGKQVMGVLLFQDLAVVPLLVLIPALAETPGRDMWLSLSLGLGKGALLVLLLLWGGPKLMRHWLLVVARRKSDELFMLNILLVTLGLAWLTEHAGLSLALGAFLAGMLIAETEFKHQVETDIRPFHDVLLGLFFITIGMKLDWWAVWRNWPVVLLLTAVPLLAKTALTTLIARGFGASTGVALRTGLYLAQAGEFGFVLLTLSLQEGLMSPLWVSPVLAAMVLSMLATPFLIQYSDAIVMRFAASDWMLQSVQLTSIAKRAMRNERHVIICGYGRYGQNLASLLARENMGYTALDLDPDRVQQAMAAGHNVVFGDSARLQSLMAAGLARACAVVVSYADTPAALKILALVREHAPHVPVVVRTRDELDLERLRQAGATEVVPEALEGSLMLATHALALVGVPMRRVIRVVQEQRDARYALLRGYFHGADDDTVNELDHERLTSVVLPPLAGSIGQALASLDLPALSVRVVQWRRASGQSVHPESAEKLEAADTLVLSGLPADLALASERLLRN